MVQRTENEFFVELLSAYGVASAIQGGVHD
jgi:hypothetical protein